MKKYNILILIFGLILILSSCNDDEGDRIPPEEVSGISATPGFGSLTFHWTNPDDEDLFYVDITFMNSKGRSRSVKTSSYADSVKVEGFSNTDDITFSFKAYDDSRNASSEVTYVAAPEEPVSSYIIDDIGIEPDFGGVKLSWDDLTGTKFFVSVGYVDGDGNKTVKNFPSVQGSNIYYISGLTASEQDFIITATDDYENSVDKTVTLSPMAEVKINKSTWNIVDFSSQEVAGEGTNGLASEAIDDDISTYWHSQWQGASPGYPHWFVVDMGTVVTISRFECFRRQNDARGQTECQFLTSLDGITWEDQGIYPFNPNVNDGQSYRMITNPQARYFKYVATNGPKFFAFLAECIVYGSEE